MAMTVSSLSSFSPAWQGVALGLGAHLWQSTLFTIAVALLTLVLRKNRARVRHWLWLAASVKFLVPFALLINLGSHLPFSRDIGGETAFYSAVDEVSQHLARPTAAIISQVSPSVASTLLQRLLLALLAITWSGGLVAVLCVWRMRWRRVSLLIEKATPLRSGREVGALRRMERICGIRTPLTLLLSQSCGRPGVFGVVRPVLIWPEGISRHLANRHLDAILAHELRHVRRCDNLFTAMHMMVEAIFWFHPLVWWVGSKLLETRESACDEEVLELGNERHVYAESILKASEFCVISPWVGVSAVTGADLKKRLVRIMTQPIAPKLDFKRKLLLGAFALVAVAIPVVFGVARPMQSRAESQAESKAAVPVFEVATIKQNKSGENAVRLSFVGDRFTATNVSPHTLLRRAYGILDSQISGEPSWFSSERYDIEAKVDGKVVDDLGKLSQEQQGLMLKQLFEERFNLKRHYQAKDVPIYAIVVAKGGPKIQEAKRGDSYPNGFKRPDGQSFGQGLFGNRNQGRLIGQGVPISSLVGIWTNQLGRIVIDKTDLKGNYDFTLQWTPDEPPPTGTDGAPPAGSGVAGAEPMGPSFFQAIQQQLGLKLEPQKGSVEFLVIDHVERPSQN